MPDDTPEPETVQPAMRPVRPLERIAYSLGYALTPVLPAWAWYEVAKRAGHGEYFFERNKYPIIIAMLAAAALGYITTRTVRCKTVVPAASVAGTPPLDDIVESHEPGSNPPQADNPGPYGTPG